MQPAPAHHNTSADASAVRSFFFRAKRLADIGGSLARSSIVCRASLAEDSSACDVSTGSGPGSPSGQPAWGGGCDRVDSSAGGTEWQSVNDQNIDTSVPYRYLHPDGSARSIAVFFYDGPTS